MEIVEALARLQLAAHRNGRRVVVTHADDEIAGLVELCGLTEALRLELQGQPEEREEPLDVEEERELPDRPVP